MVWLCLRKKFFPECRQKVTRLANGLCCLPHSSFSQTGCRDRQKQLCRLVSMYLPFWVQQSDNNHLWVFGFLNIPWYKCTVPSDWIPLFWQISITDFIILYCLSAAHKTKPRKYMKPRLQSWRRVPVRILQTKVKLHSQCRYVHCFTFLRLVVYKKVMFYSRLSLSF